MILKFFKKSSGEYLESIWRVFGLYGQIIWKRLYLKKRKKERLLYIELSRAIHILMVNGRP